MQVFSCYEDLVRNVYDHGQFKPDRTGINTRSLFAHAVTFDLSKGFPAVTTKQLVMRLVTEELAWMMRGSVDVRELQARRVKIWDKWMREDGTIGPGYGLMWRSFPGPDGKLTDQLQELVDNIRRDPNSRRLMLSAWHAGMVPQQALPPCHYAFEVYVQGGKLSLMWHQRSADLFLGVPYNIGFYALLTHILARMTGYEPGRLSGVFGDTHLYLNTLDQTKLMLSRTAYEFPTLVLSDRINKDFDLNSLTEDDARLEGYRHHPHIAAEVAV